MVGNLYSAEQVWRGLIPSSRSLAYCVLHNVRVGQLFLADLFDHLEIRFMFHLGAQETGKGGCLESKVVVENTVHDDHSREAVEVCEKLCLPPRKQVGTMPLWNFELPVCDKEVEFLQQLRPCDLVF